MYQIGGAELVATQLPNAGTANACYFWQAALVRNDRAVSDEIHLDCVGDGNGCCAAVARK